MQKQDLIEVIKKFAALPENQRTEFTINGERRKTDIIWDFVAADVSSLAIFKSSSFSHQDLDEAMAEVDAESERSDIKELRRIIEQQQFYLDNMQKELSANRKKLESIKKRPVMFRKLRAPRDASRNFS
jgi:septal ring factor EnvC (AmiA/AmiB activator)